ncbi:carboxymuconolactone decarboxylase family protein [Kitasatospora sp. NPDC002040]|uniref:carboxymuconolactone decarboxylase family protein n=1 Tax=Kitasatospora sp. NPDC002040 TaxID=3154661 RepID=UPI00333245CE
MNQPQPLSQPLSPLQPRPDLIGLVPRAYAALNTLHTEVLQASREAGPEAGLLTLVRLRCSQLNASSYCVEQYTADARALGESEARLRALAGWRESGDLFTPRERAALALAETVTLTASAAAAGPSGPASSLTPAEAACIGWTATVANAYNRVALASRITSTVPVPAPGAAVLPAQPDSAPVPVPGG